MKGVFAALIGLILWLLLVIATLGLPSGTTVHEVVVSAAPTPIPAEVERNTRPTSSPFTGDLSRFEGADRDKHLQVERVMDVLKISEGKSVADIGAGSGWFTVRAARRVGPTGRVFAVDINADFIEHINRRATSEGSKNIKAVLGKVDDPLLPAGAVDPVLILKTYHEFAEPVNIMKNVRAAMKKGGLVGIIDRNGAGDDHGLDEATVISEMKRPGFAFKERHDFVKGDDMDYFLVFHVE